MARYKNYSKGDEIASIRMFGWTNESQFYLTYEAWLNEGNGVENIVKIPFVQPESAEKLMKKLGYKEDRY
jgi:adenylate cyclase class IV